MERAKARLKKFIKVIGGKVGMELSSNSFFKKFGNVWKVRDGAEVIEVSWIRAGFLKYGSDSRSFQRGGYSARSEGGMNNISDERGKSRNGGFDKRRGERV